MCQVGFLNGSGTQNVLGGFRLSANMCACDGKRITDSFVHNRADILIKAKLKQLAGSCI